jgi:hypothetical protein
LRDFVSHKVSYPIENFISYENITKEYKIYLISIESKKEPNNFEEAIGQPIWCRAMKEYLNVLEKNKTWKLIPLLSGKNP